MELATGKVYPISAKAVILATGGLGRTYEPSTNALIVTGDGMSLAYRAGAPLMDMEMVQFHPTTLPSNGALITEAARGEGAYLLNANGERFLKNYDPVKMELGTRDVISRAEQTEINEGRGVDGSVLLDCTHLGKERILKNLSQIYELALSFANVDITKEPVPVRPGMHYQMGGVSTDINGLTHVPGLYAAGECACVSVHGANRLGANSLLETVVYGRRAGAAAAAYAQATAPRKLPEQAARTDEQRVAAIMRREGPGENAALLRLELGRTMHDRVGIFRTKAGLEQAISAIRNLRERYEHVTVAAKGHVFNYALQSVWELGFMLDCAEAIAVSALRREESRGAHYRLDFPHRDDANWLKHTLAFCSSEGPRIDYRPVRITRWEPERTIS
jgi:succinate dehydrogenase / fumarate reductase flavoprotein subunit